MENSDWARYYDSLPLAITIRELDGRAVFINRAAEAAIFVGHRRRDLLGESVFALRPECADQWHAEGLAAWEAGATRGVTQILGRWYERHIERTSCGLLRIALRDVTAEVRARAVAALLGSLGDVGPLALGGSEPELAASLLRGRTMADLVDLHDESPDVIAACLWRLSGEHESPTPQPSASVEPSLALLPQGLHDVSSQKRSERRPARPTAPRRRNTTPRAARPRRRDGGSQ